MKKLITPGLIAAAAVLGGNAPDAGADPTTCPDAKGNVNTYTTYVPCPRWDFLPERGGGNHRWPDGSDE